MSRSTLRTPSFLVKSESRLLKQVEILFPDQFIKKGSPPRFCTFVLLRFHWCSGADTFCVWILARALRVSISRQDSLVPSVLHKNSVSSRSSWCTAGGMVYLCALFTRMGFELGWF